MANRGADPCALLRPALKAWIKADTAVIAAFAGKTVKVFAGFPPANTAKPYVVIASLFAAPLIGDCFAGSEVDYQLDVWSLTDPPGSAEAEAIAPAVAVAAVAMADPDSPAFGIAGWAVKAVQPISTSYLTDPSDGKTAHALIRGRITLAPR